MQPIPFLALAVVLSVIGYAFGVLTPAQLDRELGLTTGAPDRYEDPVVARREEPSRRGATDGPAPGTSPDEIALAPADLPAVADAEPPNSDDTVRQFMAAAERGEAEAQFNLAYAYDHGEGVTENDTEAVRWYHRAAEQGHASAQNDLARHYETGEGVTHDMAEAVLWYRRAAEQGFALSQNNLGILYEHGRGVADDAREAASWYRRAAENGSSDAQFNLANLYESGRGVERDLGEAVRWYGRAAESGDAEANNQLAWFLATAPADELRDGRRAVDAAQTAVSKEPENGMYVDTLAAAYAEAGQFDQAVAAQEMAIELVKTTSDQTTVDDFTTRLELYQNGQPARQ